jgi:LysM repeat protein
MKLKLSRILTLVALISVTSGSTALGQTALSQSSNETRTAEIARAQEAVNKVLFDAGNSFRDGLLAYVDQNRQSAAEKFNRSVEAFLYSALNIQREPKLQNCYNQLIETVYRIEFPADNQPPQVLNLSQTCGWTIDTGLADLVAKAVRTSATKQTAPLQTVAANGVSPASGPQIGFATQEFEPSPLDELAKLQLNPDEEDVTSPEAQKLYQYIEYAVANKSLGFTFQVHPMIQQFINYYRGRGRATMEVGLYRSGMFMRMARRIFKEEGVPENVAWLGQVESAWKPQALSWASASGLWQFIPSTGYRYGLRRTAHVDERNSFDQATRASARYLKFLANRYNGNWELAMAAYNSGEGNVDRAIRRAGVANFWVAYPYLPRETRNYVPNILATILIANNPHQYGFGHIRPAPALLYDEVRIPASTNLAFIAQAADTTVQYLRYLNPNLRSNVTPPEPYIVNVPPGTANEVVAVFRRVPASKINNTNLAKSSAGETWQTLSNRTGVSVAELMAANPGMKEPMGKVFVPVSGNNVMATSYSRPVNQPVAAASRVKVVKAKAGDTVEAIATREKADAKQVALYNGLLPSSKLSAGREIRIPPSDLK